MDTFQVSTDSVRRWKNLLHDKGEQAFFIDENRHGWSHKLLPDVLLRIQGKMNRAESLQYCIMREIYNDKEKDGRMILKETFESDADMIPDYEKNILTVRLHSLSTPRANQVVKKLCILLNQTETCFSIHKSGREL